MTSDDKDLRLESTEVTWLQQVSIVGHFASKGTFGDVWRYGMGVCVPPKFICWNLNTQCDGVRKWDLWEVLRS